MNIDTIKPLWRWRTVHGLQDELFTLAGALPANNFTTARDAIKKMRDWLDRLEEDIKHEKGK